MLYTDETVTCPVLSRHYLGRCEDCNARYLSLGSLARAEDGYHVGWITQDQYEAYCYVWALKPPTGSRSEWRDTPTIPAVRRVARKLLWFRGWEIPAELVD